MRVNTRVPCRARETLAIPVVYMQAGLGVAVPLGQTEVDHVNLVASFPQADEKVIGFDVAMDEVPRVYEFNP